MTVPGIKILLIEEQPEDLQLTHELLHRSEDQSFELDIVNRLSNGLKCLQEDDVDIVLASFKGDESEVINTFKELSETSSSIPILYLSKNNDEDFAIQLVSSGAQDFLYIKEMTAENLWRSIQYAIERKRTEESLRNNEERYRRMIEGMNGAILRIAIPCGTLQYVSPAVQKVFGGDPNEMKQSPDWIRNQLYPEEVTGFSENWERLLEGKPAKNFNYRIKDCDGQDRYIQQTNAPVYDADENVIAVECICRDVTTKKLAEEEMYRAAFYDAVTGLPNRALFLERIERCSVRAQRKKDYRFAVIYLDLDRFKSINDSLGHQMGDLLLCEVAKRLLDSIREGDTACRLGGDEFTVLLDDIKQITDATRVAKRIEQKISEPFLLADHGVITSEIFTSASIGISLSSPEECGAESLMRDADTAMYRAKELGRGRHILFDREMHDTVQDSLQLETDLRNALKNEEIFPVYQPILSVTDGRVLGMEVLVRWKHEERGIISPGAFIPMAEETGLIIPIGEYILEKACLQMSKWREKFNDKSELRVCVNVSARQFSHPSFIPAVENILQETQLPPWYLTLEITESVLIEGPQKVKATFEHLKKMGIQLHLDDFGTGYSSLSYLHEFSIDAIKIDRSFIRNINESHKDQEIVRAILLMADVLGIKAVAEGVERQEQIDYLRKLNCPFAQGYYFSKPLKATEAELIITMENVG